MKNRIALALATVAAAAGVLFIGTAPASANQTFWCSSNSIPGMNASATRINYGPGSAIYGDAVKSIKDVRPLAPDVYYTFYSFTSTSGLQSRYTTPTQWGNTSNMLDFSTEYIKVTWKGKSASGSPYPSESCTIKVGY